MAYKHGIYTSEIPTALVPMTQISAGLPVVFGTAPLHLASESAGANVPKLCYKYSEAVEYFGYSEDWEKYTLCESMKAFFSLYTIAPVVFINVLDPAKHKTAIAGEALTFANNVASISGAVMIESLVVTKTGDRDAVLGVDYTAEYDDDEVLIISALEGGILHGMTTGVEAAYNKLDPSAVTANDIVGGVDITTGKNEGFECLNEIYPRFGLIPGIIIAPGWSHSSAVAAVMKSKADTINGRFKATAFADIPVSEVKKYSDVYAWKNAKNFVDPQLAVCWPMVALADKQYHLSTHLAGVCNVTDSAHDDTPYWSPSNQNCQMDAAVVGNDEIYLGLEEANYINGNGIITVLNENGWKVWGNRTSCYPGNTDVKDAFLCIRRMFCWVANTLITSFWSKIDAPLNKRLIHTIVDSANDWLNGLTNRGYLLGGRVEFLEEENTTTALMDGIINFHVYMTPPSPAREINFIQEYDVNYVKTLFE